MSRTLVAAALLGACLAPVALAAEKERNGAWQQVTPSGSVTGLDGKTHSAACSGYPGTDSSFKFWSRKGKSRNLVVYFEGGGACWDDLTCTFPYANLPAEVPQLWSSAIVPGDSPAGLDGLFNLRRGDNPVKDWDMVYVPYCTGDLHDGTTSRPYENAGHPVFALPSPFEVRHNGFGNLMVVLDWVKNNLQAPEQLLVAGSSAGGYGASINFPWLRKLYPAAKVSVLADASQGVTTPIWDQSTPGRGSWNVQLPPWASGLDPTSISGPELLRLGAQAHPEVRVAQFTTNFDLEQVQFYGLMKEYYGPGGNCADPVLDWNRQAVSSLVSYAATLPNYRHYVAAGTYHTILTSPEFFSERSAGLAFKDWLEAMLESDEAKRKPRWQNLACLGCLIELPCPN